MPSWQFKLLYDGECPFCRREVDWLKRRDRKGHLATEDIAALGFDPAKYGLSREEVTRVLHGLTADGRILKGMDAVRASYRAVGLGWLVAPTRWPLLRTISDYGYRLFARNRVRWGRWLGARCDEESCTPNATTGDAARPVGSSKQKT
jgi:predicted DCC family thiol-disulfide oxidoreductase YuxK